MARKRGTTRPLIAALLIAAGTLICAHTIRENQRAHLAGEVEAQAREFATKLEERVRARLDVADLLRHAAEQEPGNEPATFAALAAKLHARHNDIQSLNWIGPDGVIRSVTPYEANRAALGLDVMTLPVPARILHDALQTRSLRTTPPITLAQGGRGFVAYLPVIGTEGLAGYVNVVFRTAPLIARVAREHDDRLVHIAVRDGDEAIWPAEIPAASSPFASTQWIELGGREWTIEVAPTAAGIAASGSVLDETVLGFGLFAALALFVALREAEHSRATLIDREERFDLAMRGASDGLFDWNAETGESFYSPRWFQMLGYEPGELEPGRETFLSLLHPQDAAGILKLQDGANHSETLFEDEFRMRHKDGRWVDIMSRAIVLRDGSVINRVVGTHVDITELRRQQKELELAARTDDLTGLRNRRGLPEDLEACRADLSDGERIAVLHLDLDMFKSINDTRGHEAGDFALRTTAHRLLTDPARFDVLARVGGDEFLLAKRIAGSDGKTLRIAEETIARISETFEFDGTPCRIGASVGIAFLQRGEAGNVEEAIARADIALNTAKQLGRGRSLIFTDRMQRETVYAAALTIEIEEALRREEFVAHFQPQTDMATGEITGLEALARWNHPTRGLLTGADFVGYAETGNLIRRIDECVLDQACRLARRLPELGLPDATISVNVSTSQLMDPDLSRNFARTAEAAGIALSRIRIEILESTLLSERTERVASNIRRLAELGVRMDLDDFGTGHAAISSLLNFPISRVKLDRSLVTNIHRDCRRKAIAHAIIEMASSLSVEVLAEGIETEAELQFLEAAGCQFAQGYHIAPPMAAEALAGFATLPRLRASA